ncbi:acylphosphatase [Sneathiella limimaris]|uniref:acylphosphatase n=1 Tax=Sneathiella limimaris TaxID=1964213 RepID=UPI00146CD8E1|nr:acylphosphatase [Sneathiella limimaris]
MIAVHARITGRVQGVGYRAWTVDTARKLGVTGWVRNRLDGSVEAVFQGGEDRLLKMQEKCWDGPLLARVKDIQTKSVGVDESLRGFEARSTL